MYSTFRSFACCCRSCSGFLAQGKADASGNYSRCCSGWQALTGSCSVPDFGYSRLKPLLQVAAEAVPAPAETVPVSAETAPVSAAAL